MFSYVFCIVRKAYLCYLNRSQVPEFVLSFVLNSSMTVFNYNGFKIQPCFETPLEFFISNETFGVITRAFKTSLQLVRLLFPYFLRVFRCYLCRIYRKFFHIEKTTVNLCSGSHTSLLFILNLFCDASINGFGFLFSLASRNLAYIFSCNIMPFIFLSFLDNA